MCLHESSVLSFAVACARCGGNVELIQNANHCGTENVAVVRCLDPRCNRSYYVAVQYRALRDDPQGLQQERRRYERVKANA